MTRLPTLGWYAAVSAFLTLLAGCAVTYMDDAGNTHVVGLVNMTVPAQTRTAGDQAPVMAVRVTTVGASLLRTDIATGFAVGYSSEEFLGLPNNSCVNLDMPESTAGTANNKPDNPGRSE